MIKLSPFRRGLDGLPDTLASFVIFGIKQASACLFAGCLLAALILTKLIWQDDWPLARYDALVLFFGRGAGITCLAPS